MRTEQDLADIFTEFAALAPAECRSFDAARLSPSNGRPLHLPDDRSARRRRIRLTIAGLFGVGLVGGGGAFAYSEMTTSNVTDDTVVTCYASPRYSPEADYVTVHEQKTADGPPTHLTNAVAACARMWRGGILPPHAARSGPNVHRPVPQLSPCIAADGTVAVFPGPAACAEVGLPPLTHPPRRRR